jgi:hypothetical protein
MSPPVRCEALQVRSNPTKEGVPPLIYLPRLIVAFRTPYRSYSIIYGTSDPLQGLIYLAYLFSPSYCLPRTLSQPPRLIVALRTA